MKILFIGDIVGKPGRVAIHELLPAIIAENGIDFVIANCENAAGGFGITAEIVQDLLSSNIDVLTSGNHIWDKKEVMGFIDRYERLLRPANYPKGVPGHGSVLAYAGGGIPVGVINLQGRIFMSPIDCPFRKADEEIEKLADAKIIVIDMHAEATSEKIALSWYVDGRVSAVFGTHTHVQTADERILPGGTACITDAGMTGPLDSVIGMQKDAITSRFLLQIPNKFDVAKGDVHLQGVVVDIDPDGKASEIRRLNVPLGRH